MDSDKLIESYLIWIKDNTFVRSLDSENEFTVVTPFMDRRNDHLEIYVIKNESHITLTDDGYTLEDLKMSGVVVNSDKREKILTSVLAGFGVKKGKNDELFIEASAHNIGQKNIICCKQCWQ